MPAPTIGSIIPATGSVAGGTQVVINGSGFTGVTDVYFGMTKASPSPMVANDTTILVSAPAAAAPTTVPLTLISPNGNVISNPLFVYTAASNQSGGQQPSGTQPTNAGSGNAAQKDNTGQKDTAGQQQSTTSQAGTGQGTTGQGTTGQGTTGQGSTGQKDTTGQQSNTGQGTTQKDTTGQQNTTGQQSNTGQQSGGGSQTFPAQYMPGGAMVVPNGQTGLGGTAGTGAGFGVGPLLPGGGGGPAPSNLPYYVDPALTSQLVQSFVGMLQSAASPDALEAQNIILRRIALEGDVIGSRVPPPRNISEIGGYLNLLTTYKQNSTRDQALAGILGVAGPTQPLGWISNNQPLAMLTMTNDRPPGPAQSSLPLTVQVRSDFAGGLQNALKTLHALGATLPLLGPPVLTLPPATSASDAPLDILAFLGRAIAIAPTAAVANPATDPVVIARSAGTDEPFALFSNVLTTGGTSVTPAAYDAITCTATSNSMVQLTSASLVPLAPILAIAGFYPSTAFATPSNSADRAWARLTNVSGLVANETRLGDELSLLFRPDQIVNSRFAPMLQWTWNGDSFVA